ncbi:YceD family protein [Cribrihabitans neustonicus]|uniref:YceD family protein n=1 Tax=Cribrihabitans neustonicus TaxID=1429085 RepID=UPI003B5C59A0
MSDSTALRVADLPQNAATAFDIQPGNEELAALARELGVNALRKLRFTGELRARGKRDWQLKAHLGATVVQDCVVTLEPVTTRIEEEVQRVYLARFEMPEESEAEMPEDDTTEPLGTHIDPAAVMAEALALHIPAYPRKAGAELGEAVYAEPGVTPIRDEDTKPFAGLAALRGQLKGSGENGEGGSGGSA